MNSSKLFSWWLSGGDTPDPYLIVSATVEDSTPDVLDLVFASAININTTGWTIVTDAASGVTISSVLSGDGTTTPKFQLSRSILFDETLYLVYAPGTSEFTDETALEAFSEPITRNINLSFNGISQYGSFGDILDSLFAANDTYFELEIRVDNVAFGTSQRFITKFDVTTGAGFNLLMNATNNPTFVYGTNTANRRIVVSTGALANGDVLTLKYDGSIDTGDGLDRVTFEINGVATGKTLAVTNGTLPSLIPNVADFLGYGDIVDETGVNNAVSMFKGNAYDLIIRSSGGTVQVNVVDPETGTDTSGNARNMTYLSRIPTTYTLRSNRDISAGLGYTAPMDWQGRPRIVEREGVWIMIFIEGDEHTTDGSQSLQIAFSENKGMPWLSKNTFTDGSAVVGIPFNGGEGFCVGDPNLILCANGDLVAIGHKRLDNGTFQGHFQSRSTDGGKTWSDWEDISAYFDGLITQQWACYDYTIDDNDIVYTAVSSHEGDLLTAAKCSLYRSTDHCATWEKVSDITALGEITWEAGIEWLGGTTLLSVIRSSGRNESGAEVRRSTDLGETWSALTDITITSKGLHQPKVKKFANENRVYVSGRIYDSAAAQRNGFLYSDNNGTSWTLVEHTAVTATDDGGYADLMKREAHVYVMVGYSGVLGDDGYLREYVIIGS